MATARSPTEQHNRGRKQQSGSFKDFNLFRDNKSSHHLQVVKKKKEGGGCLEVKEEASVLWQ